MITITFDQAGDFQALYAAKQYLKDRGFSVGSSQHGAPVGILFGDYLISKWRGMNEAEVKALHGVLRGDGRNGPVHVDLLDSAPPEAKLAFERVVPA